MQTQNPAAKPKAAEPCATYKITLPGGVEKEIRAGAPIGEYIPKESAAGIPIVAVRFNNKVASLQRPVDRDAAVDYVDLGSRDGALIYRRSLTFLLIRAVRDLFPDLKVYINHSLNRGYYGEVYNEITGQNKPMLLAPTDVERIKAHMKKLVDADVPFERREVPINEAVELFKAQGLDDKVALMKYRNDKTIAVYTCGPIVNHFFGQLLPSTGLLKFFDLHLCGPGFVLLPPPHATPGKLPPYVHHEKIFQVFQEYEHWSQILGVRTVADVNQLVDTKKINEYVLVAEALHEKKLARIADMITEHPRHPRIILLSGPSSSGKTTTVKRLSVQLRVNGMRPLVIGLDDFFVERERTPKDETGEYDFESFQAIDVALLQDCVRKILRNGEVRLPHFDFIQGKPVPGELVQLLPGQPLILEGIHALNPDLLPEIPDGLKFKIFISPLTHLNIDDHNRIGSGDTRLIRRLVRDSRYRGYDGVATLSRWPSVRRGEEKNILPYQDNADIIFNSSLPYEVLILKQHAMQVLQNVPREHPIYSEAARLIKFMSYYRNINPDIVPRHSLLREFIGGSSFKY